MHVYRNFLLFSLNSKDYLCYNFNLIKKRIKIKAEKMPLYLIVKKLTVFLMLFYLIFQILSPSGFCFKICQKIFILKNLSSKFTHLEKQQFYLNQTITALSLEKSDVIDELLIEHIGNNRQETFFIYLSKENSKDKS